MTGGLSFGISVYPYMARVTGFDNLDLGLSLWYGWVVLALIVIGGLLGIIGSAKSGNNKLLSVGGGLALFSVIIFAVGLQLDFLNLPSGLGSGTVIYGSGSQALVLFGIGSLGGGFENYFAYLSFGFWIALVAAIVMFIASRRKPVVAMAPPPLPPSGPIQ